DVVDARGTAADVRVRQFHEFNAGNGAQQLARSLADFLAVQEVAGVLIGDAQAGFLERSDEAKSGEKFGDIAHFGGEDDGGGMLRFVGGEEVIVLLERGAAARGVGEDSVELAAAKGGDV